MMEHQPAPMSRRAAQPLPVEHVYQWMYGACSEMVHPSYYCLTDPRWALQLAHYARMMHEKGLLVKVMDKLWRGKPLLMPEIMKWYQSENPGLQKRAAAIIDIVRHVQDRLEHQLFMWQTGIEDKDLEYLAKITE